jgi:predicted nucleic acid-binding protein
MPSGELVFDTTCPLYLTAAGHEHLLAERYGGRCYLPDEARAEIERGEAEHNYNCRRLLTASWWRPLAIREPEDQALFFELLQRWGKLERNRGEAASIVLARRLGATAVIDDSQARRAAQTLGVPITGTVGILARLTVEGRLDELSAWAIHQGIVQLGFRSPLHSDKDLRALVARLS